MAFDMIYAAVQAKQDTENLWSLENIISLMVFYAMETYSLGRLLIVAFTPLDLFPAIILDGRFFEWKLKLRDKLPGSFEASVGMINLWALIKKQRQN